RTGAPSGASAIVEREQIQSFGALSQAPQSPPGRIPVENKKSTAGVAGGLGAGAAASYAEASPPPPAAFAESQPQNAAKTAPGPANSGVPQFAPAAAPPAVSAPPAAAQSVAVVNAGPSIETTSADVLDSVLVSNQLHGALVPHALPSRLSVLSIANYGGKVLAIDARNAVFLSADSGRHWKPVRAAWQGRAIKADLVSPSVGFGAGAMSSRGNMVSFAGRDRSLAPAGNASLTGTVTDRSGAVIPGATVVVTDPATKIAQTVKTDADGRYVAGGLAGGAYNLEAQAPGFAALRLGGVRVDALQPNVANLTLNVGAVSQTVTVEAAPQASRSVSAARLSAVAPPAALPALPVFEITTDAGDRWTSADGETWKHD
ncbi:MAG: carboxypeptidase-like regulatory domain-containing protein, partial [Terracidiphilus sp.]